MERDMQARGFPGKVKAYKSKQAILVRRPGQEVQSKGQGEKLGRETSCMKFMFAFDGVNIIQLKGT